MNIGVKADINVPKVEANVNVGGGALASGSGSVGVGGGIGNSGIGMSGGIGVSSGVGVGVSSGVSLQGGVGVSSGGSMGGSVSLNQPVTKIEIKTPNPKADTNIKGGVSVGLGLNAAASSDVEIESPNTNPMLSESLRVHSVCAVCTLCKNVSHTKVENEYNILSCIFAYFCFEFWACIICYKRKNWTCYNAKHDCGHCGKYIDTYNSC